MTLNIKTAVVAEVCTRIQDMLLTTLEEETNQLIKLRLIIDFLESLQDCGNEITLNFFNAHLMDLIYLEILEYLSNSSAG